MPCSFCAQLSCLQLFNTSLLQLWPPWITISSCTHQTNKALWIREKIMSADCSWGVTGIPSYCFSCLIWEWPKPQSAAAPVLCLCKQKQSQPSWALQEMKELTTWLICMHPCSFQSFRPTDNLLKQMTAIFYIINVIFNLHFFAQTNFIMYLSYTRF